MDADFVRTLVAGDPHGTPDRLLNYLVRRYACSAAAVLARDDGSFAPVASVKFPIGRLAEVADAFARDPGQVPAPLTVATIADDGQELGLLVVERSGPTALDLQPMVCALAEALRLRARGTAAESTLMAFLSSSREDALTREQTLATLEATEWNIAHAARRLGVTRRTIYLRLERWGLPRQKIRKGRRALRQRAATA
jgi:hypothetical protein